MVKKNTLNGLSVFMMTLRMLRGAQETKNTIDIVVRIKFVLFLLFIFLRAECCVAVMFVSAILIFL